MYSKIDVYMQCPCGSGNKFKFCCYKKKDREFHSSNEIYGYMKNLDADLSFCFHGHNGCNGEIIRAHSIQRSKILSKIAVDNHVYMIGFNQENIGGVDFKSYGIKKEATTARCFCKHHDTEIFKPIETFPFSETNEQKFLYCYRAFAKFYFDKLQEQKRLRWMFKEVPNLMLNSPFYDRLSGVCVTVDENEKIKDTLNKALDTKDFECVEVLSFSLDYEVEFATSYTAPISFDLAGNQLNDVKSLTDSMKNIFVSVFPEHGKTFVLLGWLRTDSEFFYDFKTQFINLYLHEDLFRNTVSNMIVCQADNIALGPRLVDLWSEDEKNHFLSEMIAIGLGTKKGVNIGLVIEKNLVDFPCEFDLFKNTKE